MMESINTLQHSQHFIAEVPQPHNITADEALRWAEQCNQQRLRCIGDWSSLALSHLAYQFYVKASFSKNPTVSGEAYYHLWQLEREGYGSQSHPKLNKNQGKSSVYLRLAATQGHSAAQRLIKLMV